MTNLKTNTKSRLISILTLIFLFIALNSSGALAWFWRTVNETFNNMTGWDEINFSYGYWYGDSGWGYGYGYGYWYDSTFGYWFNIWTTPTPDLSSTGTTLSGATTIWTILWNLWLATSQDISKVTIDSTFRSQLTSIATQAASTITSLSWVTVDFSSISNMYIVWATGSISITTTWSTNTSVDSNTLITKALKIWNDNYVILFDAPVTITIPWVGTSINRLSYKLSGLSTWSTENLESSVCTPAVGWECAYLSGSDLIIKTYHFTEFAAATYTASSPWGGNSWGGTSTDSCPNGDTSGSNSDWKCSVTTTSTWVTTSTGTTTITSTWTTVNSTWSTIVNIKDIDTTPNTIFDDFVSTTDKNTWKVTITKNDGSKVVLSDISNSFAKAYIEKLAAAWIVSWYEDGSFKPEKTASRAEYLKIVLRSFNIDYSNADTSKLTFSDVPKNSWMAKVVVKAAELKMIDSKNKLFRPNAQISRAEAMKMLISASWLTVNENAVSEFNDVKGWAVKYIQKAKELWIVNGQTINWKVLFRPADNITRAEVSKIVVKTMELK